MSFQSVVITAADNSSGLEFVRQLLASKPVPKHLILAVKTNNEELHKLQANNTSIHILNLDTTDNDYSRFEEFASQISKLVGKEGVDTLINNESVYVNHDLNSVTPRHMIDNFQINTVAPLMLTKALLPSLKVSGTIRKTCVINITSKVGSIEDNTSGGHYSYRTSKTALNMVSKCLAVDLKPVGIKVISLLQGCASEISKANSVSNMINIIKNLDDSMVGKMLNYDGTVIPF